LSMALLLTSLDVVAFNLNHYKKSFVKYGIAEMTGMNDENLECIIEDVLKYLKDDREELDTRAIIKGKEEEVFGDRERLHMVDVKRLFARGKVLRNVSFMLIIIMALFFVKKDGHWKELVSNVLLYISAINILFLFILLLMKVNFDKYFTYFHVIFFNNDLWELNPNTDILVQMLPENFFYDTAVKAVFYFMISLVVLGLSGLCFVKKCDIQLNNYVKDYIKGDMSMHNIAKITFSEKEKKELEQYKEGLLGYLKVLDEFDGNSAYIKIEGVENGTITKLDTLRDDKVEDSLSREDIFKNAPKIKDGFFAI
jgi:aspartyl/glutamyl-tRNA(Asn/Gln) amidotransferase C subunit